jgi:hypothetical protein
MFHDLDVSIQGRHVPENLKWKVGRVTMTGVSSPSPFGILESYERDLVLRCAKRRERDLVLVDLG